VHVWGCFADLSNMLNMMSTVRFKGLKTEIYPA
jgi:hypothetical protein